MIHYLVFERNAMAELLTSDLATHVDPQFPVFFKNVTGRSAIDTSLVMNQVNTVSLIVDYIVTY